MQKEVVKTSLIAGEPGIDRFRPIAVKNQKNGVFFASSSQSLTL